MIIPKSKSKLITILIHILIWAVFGLIYFFQPITFNISLPYQLCIKQSILLGLLVIAYYSHYFIMVPKFLLKNKTSIYLLIVVGIAVVIVLANIYADDWLNIHQLMEAAFHKSGPPKHRGGRDHGWDLAMIAIIALVEPEV